LNKYQYFQDGLQCHCQSRSALDLIFSIRGGQVRRYEVCGPGSRASRRLHRNMLAIALANKLARIAWAVLARGLSY
jgi:hypothetical protein